ncbi:MAG: heparinase II/III family protein [Candidatus Latescibacterota bacterium]
MKPASQQADIPLPAPRVVGGAWARALGTHPRLLGPPGHVQELARAKAALYRLIRDDESIRTTGDIRQAMAADPARHSFEVFQTAAFAAGIWHAVEGVPQEVSGRFVAAALQRVARGVGNHHQDSWVWMTDVALVYDLFHARIAPADRQAMVAWLNPHLEVFTDDENPFHNSCLSKILCYLRVAYATWGENPRARDFRDYALLTLYEGKVLPVLLEFGAGGGWTEGAWYQRHSVWHLVEGLELARRCEGYDGFQRAPRFFYQRMAHDLAQSYPTPGADGTLRFPHGGDGGDAYWWGDESVRHARTVLGQYWRGSELARFVANQRPAGPLPPARIPNFLYEEEPDEPLPMRTFPTAHVAAGIGTVHARSGWEGDATYFRFECSSFWCNHQHYDAGHFEVFRGEPLVTESGEYVWGGPHAVNWYVRTVAHNCILVYQPGEESWPRMRDGGQTPPANDGGQAQRWERIAHTLDDWEAEPAYRRACLTAYDNQSGYLYVAGDCTAAYSPSKLSRWTRQIVFLRPHTFVVLDRVASTRPGYEKTWVLHMRGEPQIDGPVVTTRHAGRLTVQTLLPQAARIAKVEGYGYRGQAFEAERDHHSEASNRWRLEVTPAIPRREDVFLHVLSTAPSPERAEPVERGAMLGARIGDAEVWLGERSGEVVLAGQRHEVEEGVRRGRFE